MGDLKVCTSNNLSGDADIAGTKTILSIESLQAMFKGLDLREQRGAN